ncbi:16S rRNA (guanine1207-N2)-methyltransferase [Ignavigranum ruoffiae]|uniref:16S rRNA (Guanine1207-N2)-methyltransferase n=1 Tax=Ignavigranum ruoffiae TaxID=89093 RepID=A0A1H9C4G9_9LACT|nr:methyltransferase [Ignavigranum ruoffiae]SEP95871.1 16S rRNA (guanine1207-N2)-methyltransferase [Ignavigranum ruoffiae]
MTEQYFEHQPHSADHPQTFEFSFKHKTYTFQTNAGVFSKSQIDYGSQVLLESFLSNYQVENQEKILELGSGYGPISIILNQELPQTKITAVEINRRAYELAKQNAELNQASSIQWLLTDAINLQLMDRYQWVLTNPPIRAGKHVIQRFVAVAYEHLLENGRLVLVIQKKQGAPSMKKYMEEVFGNVERLKQDKGYWILSSQKLASTDENR